MVSNFFEIILFVWLIIIAIAMLKSSKMSNLILYSGVYSSILCVLFFIMDAVDVAFTEAAVGAGFSTILFLLVLRRSSIESVATRFSGKYFASVLVASLFGILFLVGVSDLPFYGDPSAPIHHYLTPYFLRESLTEIGIQNVVTSILASYRGFDTLGEVMVIFVAAVGVMLMLDSVTDSKSLIINRPVYTKVLLFLSPVVLLFALYVQFHGDYGPGGGFQAGVLFGVGVIIFGLVSGTGALKNKVKEVWLILSLVFGVLLYVVTGLMSMVKGGHFLEYDVLLTSDVSGQHLGILLVELGVGLTVFSAIALIFYRFVAVWESNNA